MNDYEVDVLERMRVEGGGPGNLASSDNYDAASNLRESFEALYGWHVHTIQEMTFYQSFIEGVEEIYQLSIIMMYGKDINKEKIERFMMKKILELHDKQQSMRDQIFNASHEEIVAYKKDFIDKLESHNYRPVPKSLSSCIDAINGMNDMCFKAVLLSQMRDSIPNEEYYVLGINYSDVLNYLQDYSVDSTDHLDIESLYKTTVDNMDYKTRSTMLYNVYRGLLHGNKPFESQYKPGWNYIFDPNGVRRISPHQGGTINKTALNDIIFVTKGILNEYIDRRMNSFKNE